MPSAAEHLGDQPRWPRAPRAARIRSATSSTVTRTPNRENAWASSAPIAPPPMHDQRARQLRELRRRRGWSSTACPRARRSAGPTGSVPVFSTTPLRRGVRRRRPTSTRAAGRSAGRRRARSVTPASTSRSTATWSSQSAVASSRIRACTGAQSGVTVLVPGQVRRPAAPRPATSAARIIILLGMQPKYGHSPPTSRRSTPTTRQAGLGQLGGRRLPARPEPDDDHVHLHGSQKSCQPACHPGKPRLLGCWHGSRHARLRRRPPQRRDPDLGQRRAAAPRARGGLGLRLRLRARRRRLGGAAGPRRPPGLPRDAPRPALRGRPGDPDGRRADPRRAHRRDLRHAARQRHGRRRARAADGDPRREVDALPGPAGHRRAGDGGDHRRAQGGDARHRRARHHAVHHARAPGLPRTPSTRSSTRTASSTTSPRASRPTPPAPTRR